MPGVVVAITVLLALWGLSRVWGLKEVLVLDESQIYAQVQLFLHGRWELLQRPGDTYPTASMFPGYQLALTAVAVTGRHSSATALRLYTWGFSLLYAGVLYGVARQFFGRGLALVRAAQGYLLPVLYPFHFLMYTDCFSLLVIMAAFWAFLRHRPHWGGGLVLASLMVRQTNVVFLPFLWAYTYADSGAQWRDRSALWRQTRQCWLLAVGLIAFLLFFLIHGRVGLDKPNQQPLMFSPGNLAISLALGAVLFLPLHLANLPLMGRWVRRYWKAALVVLLLALVVGLTYQPLHPWNRIPGLLRNVFIFWLIQDWKWRLVFTALMAFTLVSVLVTPLVRPAARFVLPFWFLQLVPVILVEPRYYLSSLVLFVLLRQAGRPWLEVTLWAWFGLGAVLLHLGVTDLLFMP